MNASPHARLATVLSTGLVAVLLAACGADSGRSGLTTQSATAAGANLPQGSDRVELEPGDFSTTIDNEYWPMKPGSKWVYREFDADGASQRVVVTVTDQTRTLANGVEARVVHDIATEGGRPIEITDDFYAQDSVGNIWYLGEETAEYTNGKVSSRAGSFEAGVDGAEPGVIVPAEPSRGMRYRQEYYPGQAEDQGEVVLTEAQAEVPFGHFTAALMTADTNPLEPEILEFKFYAPGIGPVLAIGVSGSSDREELIRFDQGG